MQPNNLNSWFGQSFDKPLQNIWRIAKLYQILSNFVEYFMQNFDKFEFGAVQKCVDLVDLRAFQRVFACKNRRRYSRERALRSFKFHSHPGNSFSYLSDCVLSLGHADAFRALGTLRMQSTAISCLSPAKKSRSLFCSLPISQRKWIWQDEQFWEKTTKNILYVACKISVLNK